MDEGTFTEDLQALVSNEYGDLPCLVQEVSTFAEAGVMTRNAGLVFRMYDGSEFQVTVVRSR